VEDERATVTGRTRRIEAVVLMHWNAITTRHLTAPVVVPADAVRVRRIQLLDEVLAHQIAAVVGAAEPFERAIFQRDGLQFGND
jgi:hypothetical protein